MKPPKFDYVCATSVDEAVAELASAGDDGKVLAGGQSLVPLLNFRFVAPRVLVDVNRVAGLSGVEVVDGMLQVGALTRMRHLESNPVIREAIPLLTVAASWVGHPQIRNRGTVGGSIAHADPAAEIPAICLLLDAEVTAASARGSRTIATDALLSGFLTTTLDEDELVTSVRIPIPQADEGWGFREFAQRRGDFALAGAAATIASDADGRVRRARVVMFGTPDRPMRAVRAEAVLNGQRLTPDALGEAARLAADEAVAEDVRPDTEFRRTLFETMTRRALEDATSREVTR